jgi:quercetin dioxygenase-like cupin family protein
MLQGPDQQSKAGFSYIAEEQLMKVIKPNEVPQESADSPLFTGGPVTRQPLVTPDMGNDFSINIVNFSAGARNKMHIHTSDQVLFVTAGKGIIATETAEEVIITGDVVHVSAGEKHWHGATPDSAFSHIALTAKGSRTTQVEE